MPIFEYTCLECKHDFDVLIKVHDKDKVKCPSCNSESVKQQFSIFSSVGEKTKANNMNNMPCAGCNAAGPR